MTRDDAQLARGDLATRPFDDSHGLYRSMTSGHYNRTGHALRAHLASSDGEVWHIVRECCGTAVDNAAADTFRCRRCGESRREVMGDIRPVCDRCVARA
ncbi:hypothetical protein SEA_BIPAUNETO_95 [Gordonia phage BiPauneto]|nr:hypothetical protein SEA_BIPAUNETO_95 [Gordonia phage BiPauneto]